MTRQGGGMALGILTILLFSTLMCATTEFAWGQAAASAPVPPEVLEEVAPEQKPEKPAESPPELPWSLKTQPEFQPSPTLELGPLTGILAPYGYSGALDTLARGWETHRLGPVRVSPFLGLTETYRTNIYQAYADKKADLVSTLNPGMRFELPLAQQHRLSLGYLGSYYFFSRYDQNNHYDHNLNVDGNFNFPGGLALRAGNTLRLATEERTSTTARQRDYNRITPYLQGAYKMADRWKLEANYLLDNLLFLKRIDRNSNYSDHNASLSLFYKFWPKTSALVQYIFTYRDHPYQHISDNIIHTPLVGLTWDPTAKLSGTVKFGYTFQNYLKSAPVRATDSASPSFSVQTVYRASQYTNITVIGQRAVQEDPDSNNNAYTNTGFYVSLNHKWHYFNVESYANFAYYNNVYKSLNIDPDTGTLRRRNDSLYAAGVGLMRPLTKFLQLRLDYTYSDRSSNFTTYSYIEHKVMAGIQSSF